MATFGFSVGDFVACIALAKNIISALDEAKGSVSELKTLISTLNLLQEAVRTSELACQQCNAAQSNPNFEAANTAPIINGLNFARRQIMNLLEKFSALLGPYTSSFVNGEKATFVRNWRKIAWLFQKDEVIKLERNLNMHMEALRLYTDALFQSSAQFQLNNLSMSIGELRREVNKLMHTSTTNTFLHSSQVDKTMLPPLHKAAAEGSLGDIFKLTELGADLNYSLPLQFFVHNRFWGKFEFEGCTPLHLASWYGQFKAIEVLLNLGANIKSKDCDGAEVIQYAIYGGHPLGAKLLLDRGADVNSKDIWGKTPLHDASIGGPTWLLQCILDAGANVSSRDNWDRTALHWALIDGKKVNAEILWKAGGDFDAKNEEEEELSAGLRCD